MPTDDKKRLLQKAMVKRVLEGDGKASHAQRRAALDNAGLSEPLGGLVNKVAKFAYKVTDDDIAVAKASGLSEDELFEIIICAAIGEATRQHETALTALDAVAMKE